MNDIIEEVIESYGDIASVQARFEYKQPMAVYNWRLRGLPKNKIPEIHLDTGISLKRLMSAATSS